VPKSAQSYAKLRAALQLRQAGVPMATISALMHHIDGNITVHYSPAQLQELIDAVERLKETEGMTMLRVVRK
jgi:predicted nucleic acid-binding protein